jgi:hypothetical protein
LPSSQPRFGAKIMTENESFADRIRDHATDDDSSRAHQAPERRRSTDVLMHRWPALVVAPILIPKPDSAPESCADRR